MDSESELRKRWLSRYLGVQGKSDTRIRTVLLDASKDAQDRIGALSGSRTFSGNVRSAQLKLVMDEVKVVLKEVFSDTTSIIKDSNKKAALAATDAFTETDRQYLEAVFRDTGNVKNFIESQKLSASIGVVQAVSRITKSEIPLSRRVYRSQALSQRWVQKQVNFGLIRGSSAQQIARIVSASIKPSVPGGVSYAAMRLGRTEINNAFHATSIAAAQDRPWVTGMGWNLSSTHVKSVGEATEICEVYSHRTFSVENVPAKPHPQCRCYVYPIVETMDVFLTHLTAGQYNSWINNAA